MSDYKVDHIVDAITETVNNMLSGVHTCLPGVIDKYDPANAEAEVKPQIKKIYKNGEVIALPAIVAVPVVFPRSRNSIIHFPLGRGDGVLIMFSERSLERWLSLGGDQEPGDPRRFDLTDAIAIPGLFHFGAGAVADNNEDLIVKHHDTGVRIKKNGNVEIGESTFKKLVNEEFKDMFNNHSHNYMGFVGTGTPTLGETSTPTNLTGGILPAPLPALPAVPAIGVPGVALGDNELTSKTEAE